MALLLSSSVFADPLGNVKGQQFFNGLLVRLEGGQEVFIAGDVVHSHSNLLYAVTQQKGKKAVKILWAGEIEVIDGLVTRINETAGIIKDKYSAELVSGLQVAGAGISAIKLFLRGQGKYIKEKLFGETIGVEYIRYDVNNEHLAPQLKDVSYFRHEITNKIQHIYAYVNKVVSSIENNKPIENEAELMKNIEEDTKLMLSLSESAKEVSPLLQESESWKQVESQLRKVRYLALNATFETVQELVVSQDLLTNNIRSYDADVEQKLKTTDLEVRYAPEFKEGHKYMDGVLVKLRSGKKKLVAADVLVSHIMLYNLLSKIKEDPPVKILWAGEMEIDADGNVVKVNAIAGIIEKWGLTDLFGVDGKGIDNLLSFLKEEGKSIWERLFSKMTDSDYIRNDGTNKHLHTSLIEISHFRHTVLESGFNSFLSYNFGDHFDPSFVKLLVNNVLSGIQEGKEASTFLRDHPSWSKIEVMLNDLMRLDSDKIDINYVETLQKEFRSLYENMMGELTVNIEMKGPLDFMIDDATKIVTGIRDLTKNKGKTYGAVKSFAASDLFNGQELANFNKADLFVIYLTTEACVTILTYLSPFEFDSRNVNALQETKDKLDQIQKKVNSLFLEKGIDIGEQKLVEYSKETLVSAATENSILFKKVLGDVLKVESLAIKIDRLRKR